MATMVNGAKIEQYGYEFGVVVGDDIVLCPEYDVAKRIAEQNDAQIKMRALYRTDWQDAE